MTNKVTAAVERARSNFQRADVRAVEQPTISKADALGIPEPRLTASQKAGWEAAGAVAGEQWEKKILAQERYEKDKAAWEKSRDDAIWAAVQARRSVG